MDTDLVLFYYTLVVMMAIILTGATCLASYLVSRTRALLFACAGFLFYFLDIALVFKDDFILRPGDVAESPFFIGSPIPSVIVGWGMLAAFWLVMCEYLEVRSHALRWVPGGVFAFASVVVLLSVPEGNVQVFLFYTMRELFMYWMLAYAAFVHFGTDDAGKRVRVRRFRRLYALLWALVTLVVVENVVFLLLIDPNIPEGNPLPFFPERNFAENLLALCCAFTACRAAWRSLAVRHEAPPMQGGAPVGSFVEQHLPAYAAARRLSKREEEVLRLVLMGKDNQNIAGALSLSPGTVKVHVHHILQKTGAANRQALARDFWEFS